MIETIDISWVSLLPPIVAIVLALITKQVIFSLLVGIFTGSLITNSWNPIWAFLNLIDNYILPALADKDHASIIIFSMLLGGMIGVVSKSGGAKGIVKLVEKIAKSARLGQIATWLMGIIIFFDDYANTLIVGNTMRPITDRLKISREKLAYIVDSTAAPVAGLFLSIWIGYELGVIGDSLKNTGYTADPFSVFLMSIPYRFYLLLTIIFVVFIAITGRDFGPMLKAEKRARNGKGVIREDSEPASDLTGSTDILPNESTPCRWVNGVLPILITIIVTIYGIYHTGLVASKSAGIEQSIRNILANSSSYTALFWASISGCLVAILLTLFQKILTLHEAFNAWFTGVKSMMLAMIILILAWSIGAVTKELKTAEYIVQALSGTLPLWTIPSLTFIIASIISFATGTSWGTMAILMPLAVPLSWHMSQSAGLDIPSAQHNLYIVVSAVLAGAVFGDHCSPISDTTVMSSMASSCDHIDHVKTQMPYAIIVGFISIILGYIPVALGANVWITLIISTVSLFLILRLFGKKSEK